MSIGRSLATTLILSSAIVLACGETSPELGVDGGQPPQPDAGPDSAPGHDARTDGTVAPGRDARADDGAVADADANVKPAGPPNIVVIMLDDAGYTDYGDAPHTDASIIQPNIKKLAQQSTRFEQYYTAPMCTPTRMSQLSGQYPMTYGILWVCGSNAEYGIPASHATLPQTLAAAGYHTATFGKWHSGQGKEAYAAHKKFDRSVVSSSVVAKGYLDASYTIDGSATLTEHKGEHQTDVTADYVVQYIKNRAKTAKPFFLNYWLNAPHSPHQPSPRWEKKYCGDKTGSDCAQVLRYKALLSQADEAIGEVLDAIDAIPGLRDRTIVLLHSDNGGTEKVHPKGNGPLRGFKTDVFEGGTRLPLYVRWPGLVAPGTVDTSLIGVQDIYPTLAELAGAAAPKGIAGKSFAAVLLGKASNVARGEPMFWSHKVANEHVTSTEGNDLVSYAVREGAWKLVYEPLDRPEAYLFKIDPLNIGANASEADGQDKSTAQPDRVTDLKQKYRTWLLATSRVPVSVASTDGAVTVNGDQLTFADPGGSASLDKYQAFNITRLDFTFAARIRATDEGRVRVIASQSGAWALRINKDDQLELNATGKSGKVTTVVGSTALATKKDYDVALTIYAFKSLDSVATLRLRDVASGKGFSIEAKVEIPPFASNANTVRLGVGGQGLKPFYGKVSRVNIFRAPLTGFQIRTALGS